LPEAALPPNPTMALGSGAISPRDMTAALATFANGGFRVSPYLVERIETADGQALYEAAPVRACPRCVTRWAEGATPPEPAPGGSRMQLVAGAGNGPRRVPGTEIPAYMDAAAMIDHAAGWLPTADEAPEFLSGEDAAPRVVTAEN